MTKKTAKPKKSDEKPPVSTEPPAFDGGAELVEVAKDLKKLMEKAWECFDKKLENDGEYDDKLASHIAWLSGHHARTVGEQRKHAAGVNARIAKLSPASVLAWVRMQTPEYRTTLVRELVAMDDKASVLS